MKAFTNLIVMALILLGSMIMVSSFVTQHQLNPLVTSSSTSSTTSLYFFDAFSAPKDDGTPGDYVCKVKCLSSHFNHSCWFNHKHASIFSGPHALLSANIGLWICLHQGTESLGGRIQ